MMAIEVRECSGNVNTFGHVLDAGLLEHQLFYADVACGVPGPGLDPDPCVLCDVNELYEPLAPG